MADRIQQRRDTKARWEQFNPILLEGEIGYVLDDPNLYKIGDGIHNWNDLEYRGFDGTLVHELGNSETAAMSQKGVSIKFDEYKRNEINNLLNSERTINLFNPEYLLDINNSYFDRETNSICFTAASLTSKYQTEPYPNLTFDENVQYRICIDAKTKGETTDETNGIIFKVTYTDDSLSYIIFKNYDTEFVQKSLTSQAGKTIKQINAYYDHYNNTWYIKNVYIVKELEYRGILIPYMQSIDYSSRCDIQELSKNMQLFNDGWSALENANWLVGYFDKDGVLHQYEYYKHTIISAENYRGKNISIYNHAEGDTYTCLFKDEDNTLVSTKSAYNSYNDITNIYVPLTCNYIGITTHVDYVDAYSVKIKIEDDYKDKIFTKEDLEEGFWNVNNLVIGDKIPNTINPHSNYKGIKLPVKKGDVIKYNCKKDSETEAVTPITITNNSNQIIYMNKSVNFDSRLFPFEMEIEYDGFVYANSNINDVDSFRLAVFSKPNKPYNTYKPTFNIVNGERYDRDLSIVKESGWQRAEIDVSKYVGCLVKITAQTRITVPETTGTAGYIGFKDDSDTTICSTVIRYSSKTAQNDTIMFPVPRAFNAKDTGYREVSFKDAKRLCISSKTDFAIEVEIITRVNDNRLKGKNIAVVGSSHAALYFGENDTDNRDYTGCRYNIGWFIYHLAPLFGYNCSNRNIGGSGWGDISRQYEECKGDISNTTKKYFDIVYIAEAINDGIGYFLNDYNTFIKGICQEIVQSDSSELNEKAKQAVQGIMNILNHSPRAKLYITIPFIWTNNYMEGGHLYAGQIHTYEMNFIKALCDAFNIKPIKELNGTEWRVWKESPSWCWNPDSVETDITDTDQQIFDYGDGIHASRPRGGWNMFKQLFGVIWSDNMVDKFIGGDSLEQNYPYDSI